MVPAAPVNSPTCRKRTEEERERERHRGREELRHERETNGRGKFAGVTEAEKWEGEASGYLGERGGGLEKRQKR